MHPKELKSRSKLHLCPWLRDAGLTLVHFQHWGVIQPISYPGKWGKDPYMLCKFHSAWDFSFPRHLLEPHTFPSSCKRNTVVSLGSLLCKHHGKFKHCPLWLCCLWRLVIFSLPCLPPCESLVLQLLPGHWPSSPCPQGWAMHPGPSHAKGWASTGAGWMLAVDW